MTAFELLKGKRVKVMTDMKVQVELEIKEVIQNNHSEDIGESTPENDWWPEQRTWTTYTVCFTNGSRRTYDNLSEIEIIN